MRRVGLQLITLLIITLNLNTLHIQFSFPFYSLHTISYMLCIFSLFFSNLVNILVFLDNLYLFFNICRSYHHSKIHLKQCSTTLHSSTIPYTQSSAIVSIYHQGRTQELEKGGAARNLFFRTSREIASHLPFSPPPLIGQ